MKLQSKYASTGKWILRETKNINYFGGQFELYPLSRTQEILVAPFFGHLLILVPRSIDTDTLSTLVIGHLAF